MTAKDAIAKAIEDYFVKFPNMSIRSLSAKTGYDRSSITKLQTQSYDKNKIDVLALWNFLSHVAGNSNAEEIIQSDSELSDNFNKNVAYLKKLKAPIHEEPNSLNFVFENKIRTIAFTLCSNRNGTTEHEISSIFGQSGLLAIQEMLDKEIIKKTEDERLIHNSTEDKQPTIVIDRQKTKELLLSFAEYYMPQHSGKNLNYITVFSQKWNRPFYKEVQQKLADLHEWICENGNKEENIGEFPGFACIFLDTLIADVDNVKEEQK